MDPGTSTLTGKVLVNGKQAAASAPLFFLDGRTLQPLKVNKGNGTAVLQGTTVKLKQSAADLLNKTFKIKFSVRMLYGKATVDAISAAVDQLVEAK